MQQGILLERKTFFFCARMTFGQSLLATDGTFRLDYASVLFVHLAVHIDET